eukprot:CAMPEP_0118872080 /NCGR_PEP_ID=MMETSP1163-20130328/14415_1 /TAXON_ID=124430 /ORGANISM="Phaeomonas parva, Strain CCMP2877" /LENGTH=117 /DNA_ID=CAMNT_0006807233 /DNA_START=36 /DNA_END=389 /DNA_ORIENTATION=+
MSVGTTETAVAYAALALHDGEVEVNSDSIAALLKATGNDVEPYWPMLFGSFVQGQMDDLIMTLGGGGGGAAAAAGPAGDAGAAGAAEEEAEKEKEEEPEEVDLGGGMDMFGGGDADY